MHEARRARPEPAGRRALAALAVLAAVASACAGDDGATTTPAAQAPGVATSTTPDPARDAAYREPGPNPVGVQTVTLADGTTLMDVWYPSTDAAVAGAPRAAYRLSDWLPPALQELVPDGVDDYATAAYTDAAPATSGPFPLVLFSHGFASYRDQSTFLATHLASWGIAVASPDHPSRGLTSIISGGAPDHGATLADLRAAVAALRDGPFGELVDFERVALAGHSAGGGTILAAAADPELGVDVDLYVAFAAGAPDGGTLPALPSVFMAGTTDGVVPVERTRDAYERAPSPKHLYEFEGAGHLAFADICEIGKESGGVLVLADAFGIEVPEHLQRLATDGCEPASTPPTAVWAAVGHFTVAHLRAAWGIDPDPVGLDAVDAFAPVRIAARSER